MHIHKYLKYTATPIKTLCVLLVLMFLIGIAQLIVIQVYWEFSRAKWDLSRQEKTIVKQTEQEKQQWDIHNSKKVFMPDGTVYLVNDNISMPGNLNAPKKMIVKDLHNKILFEGKENDCPYSYIQWHPKRKDGRYVPDRSINQRYLNDLNLIGGEFSR